MIDLKLIVLMVFVFSCQLMAQEIEITPINFDYRQSPTQIVGMTQDDHGYIWMCDVNNGMFRYDGTNLLHYSAQPGNSNSLSSNRTDCITTDGHDIWLGTFFSGLNRYNPETNTFTRYEHDPDDLSTIRSNHIRALAFDHNGMLWVGTLTGIDKLDPKTGVFTHIHTDDPDEKILETEHIRAIYIDKVGTLWVGSSSPFPNESTIGGLFKIEIEKGAVTHFVHSEEDENSLADNRVRAIYEDSRGKLWIGTAEDGLHTLERSTGEITRHSYDPENPEKLSRTPLNTNTFDHITFINEDNAGNIWIGTYAGGLSSYDPLSGITKHYSSNLDGEFRIDNNTFWTSLKTSDNLLWMAQWVPLDADDILQRVNAKPNRIKHFDIENMGRINAFASDDSGNIILGSVTGVWKENKDGTIERVFQLEGFLGSSDPGARDVEFDGQGNIWVPTIRGLYKYSQEKGVLILFNQNEGNEHSLSGIDINGVNYIGNDQLLVASQGGLDLINTIDNTIENITFKVTDTSEISMSVNHVYKDSKGKIWLASTNNGLKCIDLSSGIMKNYSVGGITGVYSGITVSNIYEDSNSGLWICTEASGAYFYDRKSDDFYQVFDDKGFLSSLKSVYSVTEDHDHNLWFAIPEGFLKFNPISGESTYYGTSWGVLTANHTDRAFTASNGEVFFSTQMGYYRFQPKDLQKVELESPKPFISQIFIDDKEAQALSGDLLLTQYSNKKTITLTHDQNNISLIVNHIDYVTNSGDKRMEYWLENFEPKWRGAESGDEVSYYNIPPGNYNFHLKAFDINGNLEEISLEIIISLPWWKKWWAYIGYLTLLILGGWLVHLFQKERTIRNEREKIKDKELTHAREIEKAYSKLKATQSQLIHAEKMASLGELTAGIAHEIQNPLNFVNNFSEVSNELIDEMNEALKPGSGLPDIDEAIVISTDIKQNLEKINHHGMRASSIVKGMLDHSRSSSGEKVLTDINQLADEYLRLSYHGLRAKDISFNAKYETAFDESLPKINIVPQDIGRVILNLINNAFQAVDQRSKMGEKGYVPLIEVSTGIHPLTPASGGDAQISPSGGGMGEERLQVLIKDNGTGIPPEIKDKIFQPFFTTKPTGQGTGLGLSLSYDIMMAHGGELLVESEEGEGTVFKIHLPLVRTTD